MADTALTPDLARSPSRAWWFVVPWVLGLCVFTIYPFAASLYYSFTDYSLLNDPIPNGVANYHELFGDKIFGRALVNTMWYSALAIPTGVLVAVGLAKALHSPVRGTGLYRAIIYIPHLVPTVASAILWMWMLSPDGGLINSLLQPILDMIGWKAPQYMSTEDMVPRLSFEKKQVVFGALPSLVLMSLWGVGQWVVIYLAKLQDVPQELYEAAELDGAGRWTIFRHVELPQLSPVILFNTVMAIIASFQIFAEPYIMTGGSGGPNYATYLMPMFIYQNAFEYLRFGYACAAAWILFGIIALLTVVAFRIAEKRVYYASS